MVLAASALAINAQVPDSLRGTFRQPFDFPIIFSGNFGELRSNHFHGGLDFKTQGASGKPVRALADGYISRIRVTHGSGYVLHVVYDNGYTTICRHLSAFVGKMAQRIEALQYERESWEVDIEATPAEYPVKRGEVIALSGNTGYSFGPHLHLDVMETATGEYIDPLPLFDARVNDTRAPQARSITLFPQRGRGVVNGSGSKQSFAPNPGKPIEAWGWIGAGICAYDYMNGAHNRYGVKTVILAMDGNEVFRSVVDRYAYSENRYINSWTSGSTMKSFIEPGNKLRMLQADGPGRGLVNIDEERPYQFHYTLADAWGNSSEVRFTVQGRKQDIPAVEHREKYHFRWDKVNHLHEPGLELVVPAGMLYTDAYLDYHCTADSGDIAFTYHLASKPIPLHASCPLRIGIRHMPVADSTKYYVASVGKNGKRTCLGGRYAGGFMEVKVRSLGTFTVAVDTTPPTITPVNPAAWGKRGRIVLKPKDTQSGISSYRATIDDAYALMGKPNSVNGLLECVLDPERVKRGTAHRLEVSVTDACGNCTTREYRFTY